MPRGRSQFDLLINLDPSRATAGLRGVENSANRVQASLSRAVKVFAGGALLGSAIRGISQFETGIAEISTLVDTAVFDIGRLQSAALAQAGQYGQDERQVVKAYYDTISAGASTATEAIQIVDAANRLAIAGVTNVAVSTDGLTSVLNAYGLAASDAADVSDTFFVGVRAGKTTIDQLATSVGKVAPLAASAGVDFQELISAVAALTAGGISTRESVTGIRAVLASFVRPTKEASDAAALLGIEFNAASLESRGLIGSLQDIVMATGGNTAAMAELFGGVEALVPVLALAGEAGIKFNQTMIDMESRTGAVDTAFQKISNTSAAEFNRALSEARTGVIEGLNEGLKSSLPLITTFADTMGLIGPNFDTVLTAATVLTLYMSRNFIAAIGSGTASLFGLAAQARTTAGAMGILSQGLALIGRNPLGALILGAGTLAVSLTTIRTRSENIESINKRINTGIRQIDQSYKNAANSVGELEDAVIGVTLLEARNLLSLGQQQYEDDVNDIVDLTEGLAATIGRTNEELGSRILEQSGRFRRGTIDLDELIQTYARYGNSLDDTDIGLKSLILNTINSLRVFEDHQNSIEAAEELVRRLGFVYNDSADDAKRFRSQIAGTKDDLDTIAKVEFAGIEAAFQGLRQFIPELAEYDRIQEELRPVLVIRARVEDHLNTLVEKNIISHIEAIAVLRDLELWQNRITNAVTGTTGALQSGRDALAAYIERARVGSLSPLDRELDRNQKEFENIVAGLTAPDGQRSNDFDDQVKAAMAAREELDRLARELHRTTDETTTFSNTQQRMVDIVNLAQGGVKQYEQQLMALRIAYDAGAISIGEFYGAQALIQQQLNQSTIVNLEQQIDGLNMAYKEGAIDVDTYTEAHRRLQEQLAMTTVAAGAAGGNIFDNIASKAMSASEILENTLEAGIGNLTNAIVDFARTGEFSLRDFGRSIAETLLKLSTESLLRQGLGFLGGSGGLFGGLFGGGSFGGSGIFNGLFGGRGLGIGFANGGSFLVGGQGGTDSQFVGFRASPNERVTIETPAQQRSNLMIPNVQVITPTNVQIINNAPGVVHRQEMSEGQIRIIAEEVSVGVVNRDADGVIGRNLRDPNSRTSQGLARNTQVGRSY